MDLDNIQDLEVLREIAKEGRGKMLKDCYANDGTDFWFKSGQWYIICQNESSVELVSDDRESIVSLTYEEAKRYIEI